MASNIHRLRKHSSVESRMKRMRLEDPEDNEIKDSRPAMEFESLPDEVILKVLLRVSKSDLLQVACLNSRFRCLSKDQALWDDKIDFRRREPGRYLHIGGAFVRRAVLMGYPDIEPILRRIGEYCPNLVELEVTRSESSWMNNDEVNGWVALRMGCPALQSVRLYMMDVGEDIMEVLSLPTVEKLCVQACNDVSHERATRIISLKPNLHTLDLTDTNCWSDTLLAFILDRCGKTLKVLYGISEVSDCSFSMISDTKLEALGVLDADQLTLDAIRPLAPHLRILKLVTGWTNPGRTFVTSVADLLSATEYPQLRHLALSAPYLSNDVIRNLTSGARGLETLTLESPCVAGNTITDGVFEILFSNCPKLRYLGLIRVGVTGNGLTAVVNNPEVWPGLEGIFLNTPNINNSILEELAVRRSHIKLSNRCREGPRFSYPDAEVHDELWNRTLGNPDLSFYAGKEGNSENQ